MGRVGRAHARPAAALVGATILGACSFGSGNGETTAPTVAGEITDEAITLDQPTAPATVWLELTNAGDERCELVIVLPTESVENLRTEDARVQIDLDPTTDEPYPMEAYVEVNGEPIAQQDFIVALRPGDSVRMQLALEGTPENGERVILCNGPGDYQAGRWVMLSFER
jgi:hypothetical protein